MKVRTMLYLTLLAVGLALVFYVTGQRQARIDAEDRAWNAGARALVKAVATRSAERTRLLARVDSAVGVARHYRRVAQVALGQADSLGAVADSLAADTSATRWEAAYQARTAQVMHLTAALNAKSAEADTLASTLSLARSNLVAAQADIDSLTLRLDQSLDRKECRVAWVLACPSRTTSFVVGVALGGLTVATVAVAASQ